MAAVVGFDGFSDNLEDMFDSWDSLTLSGVILFGVNLLINVAALIYVPRNRKPTAATAWLLLIFLVPAFGIFLFFLIGNNKLSKQRMERQQQVNELLAPAVDWQNSAFAHLSHGDRDRYTPIANLINRLGMLSPTSGNIVEILPEYDEVLNRIAADIHGARRYVYLQFYITLLDEATEPIFVAMRDAVRRGVSVHLLLDPWGSHKYRGWKETKRYLDEIGVQWRPMLPIRFIPGKYNRPDLRNHRKLAVFDDGISYIGSLNLIDRRYQRKDEMMYDELVVRMTGPIVDHAKSIFISDWFSETGQPPSNLDSLRNQDPTPHQSGIIGQMLPSGSNFEYANNLYLFNALIHKAKHEVVITNPYFVPDESLLQAVIAATRRGVRVTLINSEAMDQWMVGHAQRSYYEQLLSAGVHIRLYDAPKLLHSKYMLVDEDITVIGSSNMDMRSFELNLECVAIFYSRSLAARMHLVRRADEARSHAITLEEWKQRGLFNELLDGVARLTASLQ